MKKLSGFLMIAILMLSTCLTVDAQEKQLAFPGADGYAKYTTGGRGGKVYYVTSTEDCADNNLVPGTLRWALRTGDDSPRTILFAVNGTIYLKSKLKTNHPNISILGQSAPGGGVCITGFPLYVNNKNVIIRYVRFRAGDVPSESLTGLDVENAEDVILDHCSMTWSMEECLTMFDVKRTTVQWCIIGEGLYNSKNSKGARAYATQWGGEQTTMHHTLITNSHSRSPRFNGVRLYENQATAKTHDYQVDSEFANNVVYNWSSYNSIYGGENNGAFDEEYNRVYMVGNYYRPGPSTQKGTTSKRYWVAASSGENSTGGRTKVGQWYLSGNKFETSSKWAPTSAIWSDDVLNKVNADNLYGYGTANSAMGYWSLSQTDATKAASIIDKSYYDKAKSEFVAETADEAFLNVTTKAGASLPRYDEVDQRLLDEAAGKRDPLFTGTVSPSSANMGIIDSPTDVKLNNGTDAVVVDGETYAYCPSTALKSGEKYAVDSDADGMPDAYEDAKGFNKLDPKDGNAVAANGYTNLENYLNGLADYSLNNADYQTSATYVEPGLAVRPENVTISFSTKGAEGTAPSPITIAYGGKFTVAASNTSIYKEGYTMTGWTDGATTYEFGKTYEGVITEDITLSPAFKQNINTLAQRNSDVEMLWDFTAKTAPKLPGAGIYVSQAMLNGNIIDVALRYNGTEIAIPAAEGAVAEVTFTDGTSQKIAATGDVLTTTITSPESLKSVSVILPYTFDPTGIEFHSPQVGSGTNFELTRFTKMTDTSATDVKLAASWMAWDAQQQRLANRNCLDPTIDNGTYYVASTENGYDASVAGTTIIGPVINQKNKVIMYVKDVAKIRTFVSGSCYNNGQDKDRVMLTAYPADGSERIEVFNTHPLDKATLWSESFDVELDPDMSYMVVYSSMNGFDMMLGAVKLFDKTAAVNSGEGSIVWTWETALEEKATVDPVKMNGDSNFSAAGHTSSGISKGYQMGWFRFPSISAASDNCYISYQFTPAAGYSFAPTSFSFENNCEVKAKFDITITVGDAAPVVVKAGEEVASTTASNRTLFTYPLNIPATKETITIKIHPYNIQADKYFRLRHVTINGTYDSKVVKHSFATQVSPANAGAVQQTPKGSSLAEGTKVSLTATAASGYEFRNWTNLAGEVVSSDAEFVYTVGNADETLTANFYYFLDSPIFKDGPYQAEVTNAEELKIALKGAAASSADRFRIFLHNGVYDLGTTVMTAVPANTSLIGESQEGVVIKNNPGLIPNNNNYQDKTPVLYIAEGRDNVYMQDLTICAERDWIGKKSQGQCVALRQRSKQVVYKNVTMQGVQDTYYLNKADGSAYFENCTIAGNVDYIYGDGTAWFEQCTMQHVGSGGYIVAPNTKDSGKGFVFYDCRVEADNAGFYLGRPWDDSPAATFLYTTFCKLPNATGWAGMTDGLIVRFHEYGSKDGSGNLLDLSQRSIDACDPMLPLSHNPVLTASEAAQYTVVSTLPGWNPQELAQQLIAPTPQIDGKLLSWQAVPAALCYAICKDGKVIAFTTEANFTVDEESAAYTIRVANQMGGLSPQSAKATSGTGIVSVSEQASHSHGRTYNIPGQRVDVKSYRGIKIVKGQKVVWR